MNQPYARMNAPYATLMCEYGVRSAIVQKNNAHMLLSHILSIVNSDWLQHAHSVCEVYEFANNYSYEILISKSQP